MCGTRKKLRILTFDLLLRGLPGRDGILLLGLLGLVGYVARGGVQRLGLPLLHQLVPLLIGPLDVGDVALRAPLRCRLLRFPAHFSRLCKFPTGK